MLVTRWQIGVTLAALSLLGAGALANLAPAARALAADDAKDKADKDTIKGAWKVVSAMADGVDQPEPPKFRLTFDDKEFTFGHDGQNGFKGTFTLDGSASPKTIDLSFTDGPHAGDRMLGIYAREGDSLKLCLTGPNGADRPKEFTTAVGSGHRLFVLKKDES